MSVEEIDKSMIGFSQGKANVLLSTNIIGQDWIYR